MSVIAAALRELMAAGMSGEDLVQAVARIEAALPAAVDERGNQASSRQRYRERRNLSDREWAALTGEVIERDGWVCAYCDCDTSDPANGHSIDHVYPLSRGGGNELENLVMACRSCNSSKGDKILDEEWSPPNDEFVQWMKKGGLN